MLNGLDLFSGIGGITLALNEWVRPVAYCENDKYAQGVLLSRMWKGELPQAPIWDDVRTLQAALLPKPINIITAGFPCQDISEAKTDGKGLGGERSSLFFEVMRLARDIRPEFIFLENVPAIAVRGLDRVLLELTSLGFDSRWTTFSAAEVGALQIRERWFLLAHFVGMRSKRRMATSGKTALGRPHSEIKGHIQWPSESGVGRVVHGVQNRVDRIRGLGNAVVPVQAKTAFEKLIGINESM